MGVGVSQKLTSNYPQYGVSIGVITEFISGGALGYSRNLPFQALLGNYIGVTAGE